MSSQVDAGSCAPTDGLRSQRTVTVRSGTAQLYVADAGPVDAPLVLFLHGYPDDHRTWDLVRAQLVGRFRVATFDLRGMGRSVVERTRTSHRIEHLLEDVDAVADHLLGDANGDFHLVGHDWGSIIGWSYVTDPARARRVSTWTSISGTHLGAVSTFLTTSLRDPAQVRAGLRQARHSAYIGAFQIPHLPERTWSQRAESIWRRTMQKGGVPASDPMLRLDRDEILAVGVPGLELYRQNIRPGRLPSAPRPGSIEVPCTLVVAADDPFVSPALARASGELCARRYERVIAAGHWVQRSHPAQTAQWIAEMVDSTEGGPPLPGELLLEHTPKNQGPEDMHGRVVLITGAASGIGRATAFDAAAAGATLVLADRDKVGLDRTAQMCEALGGVATCYAVDVTDRTAMASFAESVHANHAVDVLVNNAGVGMAGPFTAMTLDDWDWIRSVNLDGVVTGCHLFVGPMIERGHGHVVNVASAAGYFPSSNMTAYNATKFAVVGFSEALEAELAGTGVRVTVVCPGIVDTDIIGSTRFVGEGEPEKTRARLASMYRRRGLGPETVAASLWSSVDRGHHGVLPVGSEAQVLYRLRRFVPGLVARLARRPGPFGGSQPDARSSRGVAVGG